MDWFDREIVKFVLRWTPFGGPPPEEVLPRFGLTAAQLDRRLNQIIAQARSSAAVLSCDDAELLSALGRVLLERRPRRRGLVPRSPGNNRPVGGGSLGHRPQ